MAGASAHAAQPGPKVTAYLTGKDNGLYMNSTPAQGLACKMSAAIGISLEWGNGKPPSDASGPKRLIEMIADTPSNIELHLLAYALLDERSHIIVLIDRILSMRTPNYVLAHVLVHEITHIL